MSKSQRKRAPERLPLQQDFRYVQTSNGELAICSVLRRGILTNSSDVRTPRGPYVTEKLPAKIRLEILRQKLRGALKNAGLPTDEHYVWIRFEGEDWQPDRDPEVDPRTGEGYELRSWHDHLVDSTEPLSENRCYGDLLYQIDELGKLDLNEFALDNIVELILVYREASLAGTINQLAARGLSQAECLQEGPQQRKKAGARIREIVWKHAEQYWRAKPAMRGNRTCTAECILPGVNEELLSLKHKPLRPKSVATYIGQGISGGNLRIG